MDTSTGTGMGMGIIRGNHMGVDTTSKIKPI